jgi:predicted acetyltransferase
MERGQGLAACVTVATLHRSRELGYRVGVLQSSPAGYSIYKRLGFAEFGNVDLYERAPSE